LAANELTAIMERWLKDSTYGVNALLNAVPRSPEHNLPTPVAIYTDLSDEDVAADRDPNVVPALVVVVDSATSSRPVQGRPAVEMDSVTVAIAYVDRDRSLIRSKLDGGYTLRAVRQSMTLLQACRDDNYRVLNKIKLITVNQITEYRVTGTVGRSTLLGFILVEVHIQDLAP
jgi:hypothetical protein